MPSETPEQRRLQWQCRRGMLELDLLLQDFLDHRYPTLEEAQQRTFERLLAQPDPLIYDWLLGHSTPPEPQLQALVGLLRGGD
jgi:antitoxin CptB